MPELRKDPVVNRWVIIATERARRPGNFISADIPPQDPKNKRCRFCLDTKDILYKHKHVRVIPFQKSFLSTGQEYTRANKGVYEVTNGYGRHEIVVESKDHVGNMADLPPEQIAHVLETYQARVKDMRKDPHLRAVMIFKNYGATAGGRRISHTRSHIVGMPANPIRVKEKLDGAKAYFDKHARCIYCDMIKQESQERHRVIHETDHFIVLAPFAARFLFEVWILPKEHHCDFIDHAAGREQELAQVLHVVLNKLKHGLDDPAYNFMIHTAPFRRQDKDWSTIEQDYHWHIELTPRLTREAGFEKGTGFYICPIPPEKTAEFLREVRVP